MALCRVYGPVTDREDEVFANAELVFTFGSVKAAGGAVRIPRRIVTGTDETGEMDRSMEEGTYICEVSYQDGPGEVVKRFTVGVVANESGEMLFADGIDQEVPLTNELLSETQDARDDAVAAAASVDVQSADAVPVRFVATFAALASVTTAQVAVGNTVSVGNLGEFTRAADDADNADLDYSGDSGVKWYVPSAGGFASLYVFGAQGDGATDDHAVLELAEGSSKHILVDDGTFLIGDDITLTSKLKFRARGQLKHTSGVTITANGLIYSDMSGAIHTGEGAFVAGLTVLTVGPAGAYASWAELFDDLPRVLWQPLDLVGPAGVTLAEDIVVSGFISAGAMAGTEAHRIRLMAGDPDELGNENTIIGSLFVNGNTMNTLVQNISTTRPTPYDDEATAIAFYEAGGNVANSDLSGTVGASKGIVSYGRGRVTTNGIDFGTNVFVDAMTVKNDATLSSKGGHTGHVTGNAFQTQNGHISARNLDGLTSDGELILACQDSNQGLVDVTDTRTIHGPTSFQIPYFSGLQHKFNEFNEWDTSVTGGGEIDLDNKNRGARFRSGGGVSGTANAYYGAVEMIGSNDWGAGEKSMIFAGCPITPSAGAAFRVVMGDYTGSGAYIGFLIEDLTPKAIFSPGGGVETVVYTYGALVEDATMRFGFTFNGKQIHFFGQSLIAPVATVTTGLPTGEMPNKKIEIDLNTTANCIYSIREMNAQWTQHGI